ncbi:MAG: HTTM domain-containing protein [Acidimicrobiales bacterium]
MTPLLELSRRADRAIDAVGSVRAIAVLRIALGPITVLHLRTFLEDLRDGFVYSDRFYDAYASWYPEAGPTLYRVLLITAVVGCVTMSIGFMSRLSTAVVAGIVGYNLFLSTTFFAHNRAFLLILLVGVGLLRPGSHLSVDALIARRRGHTEAGPAPLWPLWLLRFEVVCVYVASAVSKTIDGDWWSGRVLQLRAIDNRQLALDGGAPGWLLDVLSDGGFQWWASKVVVLTELFIGLGLLNTRTRIVTIWVAIWFHLAIQFGADVQVFSWAAIAALSIWVTPRSRTRTLMVPPGPLTRRLIRSLDWFARFEIVPATDGPVTLMEPGAGTGTERRHVGRDAVWRVLARLPATFLVAAPVVAVRATRRRREAISG